MNHTGRRSGLLFVVSAALSLLALAGIHAQGPTPRAIAPIDLTGYWVSVVTEDWRFRMVTPAKGDYASVPLNPEGRKVADTWDPAKDEAAGTQCKSYGAAALMRVPGRLHITWENDTTLRIDTDAGTQTRMLRFGAAQPQAGEPQWQGESVAQWEGPAFAPARGFGPGGPGPGPGPGAGPGPGRGAGPGAGPGPGRGGRGGPARGGSLKVVTTHLRPGYLRKNGVPYSGNTVLTEYMDRTNEPNSDSWLIVTTIVEDPQYLAQAFITSTHFKKQADASGWNPTPCAAK